MTATPCTTRRLRRDARELRPARDVEDRDRLAALVRRDEQPAVARHREVVHAGTGRNAADDAHEATSISTMSLGLVARDEDARRRPRTAAPTSESSVSPGLAPMPCRRMPWPRLRACGGGLHPVLLALRQHEVSRRRANARVSISTSMSSIMHAEYCFVPCALMREPCGMVHVCNARDLHHLVRRHDRHRRRHHLAVQVEVDDVMRTRRRA